MMTTFHEKLSARVAASNSLLCVGLDPSPQMLNGKGKTPALAALELNRRTIAATKDIACAYKPNIAFYEAMGLPGFGVLTETLAMIPDDVPVILDAKRADVGSTSEGYARFVFDVLGVDAVTVSPYLGGDALAPFLARTDKGIIILCRTSNPGARDLQDLNADGLPLYQQVAHLAQTWNSAANVLLVMGATYPSEMAWARSYFPAMWFLVPGVGAQGGDLEAATRAGLTAAGDGIIVSVSRAIMGASDPRRAAVALCDAINVVRDDVRTRQAGQRSAGEPAGGLSLKQTEDLVLGLHDIGCVQFGEFKLKSGNMSPIYVDLRRMVADAGVLRMAARAYERLLTPLTFDRLAAIPYAGLPIGTAVALEMNRPLIYPRREVKSYGTGRAIEGVFKVGETVAIIDDVITTGESKVETLAPLAAAGLHVRDIVVLIDREQGGAAELAAHGLQLHSVLNITTMLDILARRGRVSPDDAARVRTYLAGEVGGSG
jgi:uridine monophosphate synthetase